VEGAFVFVALFCLATVLLVPGLVLTMGAGYIFSPLPLSIAIVMIGSTAGLIAAFVFGASSPRLIELARRKR
jgi:uncharacterized membrane protein YdjX (TVP38/TMEM64 family)